MKKTVVSCFAAALLLLLPLLAVVAIGPSFTTTETISDEISVIPGASVATVLADAAQAEPVTEETVVDDWSFTRCRCGSHFNFLLLLIILLMMFCDC
jgi:hypothetical protein